jgi:hypothetical protein
MKFERMTAFFEQQEEGKQKKLLASSAILSMLGLAFWILEEIFIHMATHL